MIYTGFGVAVGGAGVDVRVDVFSGVSVAVIVVVGVNAEGVALVGIRPKLDARVANASYGLTGVICCCEQKFPVRVQASVNPSGESGTGGEGGLMAVVPSGPPRVMLVLCPRA